jgi:uncharacterized membrane protein YeaQ/YmgE (transglycosylase-associated protein family)
VIDVLLALNATLNAMRAEAAPPKPPTPPTPPPNSDGTKPTGSWFDNDGVRAVFLLLVIVVAGAIGGLAAHYLKSKEASRSELLRDIVVGVLAALMVPGLLQTINDQHLAEVFRSDALWPGFASQCLIVAMVGMPFIETVLRIANKRLASLGSEKKPTSEPTTIPENRKEGLAHNDPKPEPAQYDDNVKKTQTEAAVQPTEDEIKQKRLKEIAKRRGHLHIKDQPLT